MRFSDAPEFLHVAECIDASRCKSGHHYRAVPRSIMQGGCCRYRFSVITTTSPASDASCISANFLHGLHASLPTKTLMSVTAAAATGDTAYYLIDTCQFGEPRQENQQDTPTPALI